MQLLRVSQVDSSIERAEYIFRQSRLASSLLLLILCGIVGGVGYFILFESASKFLWLIVAFVGLIIPLIASAWLATFKKTNWVFLIRGSKIFIKFRSYLNHHYLDEVPGIVSFEISELVGIRKRVKAMSDGESSWSQKCLELLLNHDQTKELQEALSAERKYQGPANKFYRSQARHHPVSLPQANTVRIIWRGRYDLITPSLKRALRTLGRLVPLLPEIRIDREGSEKNEEKDLDLMILELCEAGNVIAASKLLVERRGYTLTKAREFVDQLVDSDATLPVDEHTETLKSPSRL